MNSLWTPDGEHTPPPREDSPTSAAPVGPDGQELTPEQQEQAREMARQMAETREAILQADPATVIANHALGIYELAAIHITADEPDLDAGRLAVDALATLVTGMKGRLGEAEPTLEEALQQVQLAYVQRVQAERKAGSDADD